VLTLPVSLFRSESMGFGKPKKVGMPKRNKQAVTVADNAPVTEGVAVVAAKPPSSPPRKAQEDLAPVAPKSPGVLKQIELTRDAQSKQRWADRLGRMLTRADKAYRLADRLYDAKCAAVERDSKSKKKGKLHPVEAMHKNYCALSDYLVAHKRRCWAMQDHLQAQHAADAQHIAMLQFKVRRLLRLLRVARKRRSHKLASPIARFKFGPRR
jgi:hypothetical protein